MAVDLIGKTLGGIRIESELGRGAMGVVYRGTQVALQRAVAVKVIGETIAKDQDYLARFHREAQAIAAINHPGIVGVYDFGEVDGVNYMVQEFIEGEDLSGRIVANQRLDPREAAEIFAQAARGLAAAHEKGIVHRDIKPANIMVTKSGQAKLTDFGLAKRQDTDITLTATGMIWGSPAYIAPELVESGKPSPRSDLYSLGASFYQAVTGELPFSGNAMTVMMRHLNDPLPDPCTRVPGLDRSFAKVIFCLMAKEPEDRFASADAAAIALERLARGESIDELVAGLGGDPATSGKIVVDSGRSSRGKVMALSAAALVLAVGAAGFAFLGDTFAGDGGESAQSELRVASVLPGVEPTATPDSGLPASQQDQVPIAEVSQNQNQAAPAIEDPAGASDAQVAGAPEDSFALQSAGEAEAAAAAAPAAAEEEEEAVGGFLMTPRPVEPEPNGPIAKPRAAPSEESTAPSTTEPIQGQSAEPNAEPAAEPDDVPDEAESSTESISSGIASEVERAAGSDAGRFTKGVLDGLLGAKPTTPVAPAAEPTMTEVLARAPAGPVQDRAREAMREGVAPTLVDRLVKYEPAAIQESRSLRDEDQRKSAERLVKAVEASRWPPPTPPGREKPRKGRGRDR